MEAFFKIMIMAVIQGATEFLPVSSSGHLALTKHFLRLDAPGATLELFLHGGTLLAVGVFYRRRLCELVRGLFRLERFSVLYVCWIVISMIPAGVVYVANGEAFEAAYDSPMFVGGMLCVTGAVLLALRWVRIRDDGPIGGWQAVLMGCAQALAMIPGVSRSGATICAARFAGVGRAAAAEFSLIMSMPVIAGAVLVKLFTAETNGFELPVVTCLIGAAVAFGVGLSAIRTLVRALNSGKFWMFGLYCLVVGAAAMILVRAGV